MKKKEIEKIPFRGGVRADKQYRNTAVAFCRISVERTICLLKFTKTKNRSCRPRGSGWCLPRRTGACIIRMQVSGQQQGWMKKGKRSAVTAKKRQQVLYG